MLRWRQTVVRAVLGAGVNGFVLERTVATDLLDAIAAVPRGESYISLSLPVRTQR